MKAEEAMPIAGIMIGIAAILASILTIRGVAPLPEKYESVKSFFFEELKRQTDFGAMKSVGDVETIKRGVVEMKGSRQLASADLEGLLAEYRVVFSRFLIDSENGGSREERAENIEFIDKLIGEVRTKVPFSSLPEGDQLTAMQLQNSIESGDKDIARTQLGILSTSLGKRISFLDRQAESNQRWLIVGLLATIAGILTTVVVYLLSRRMALSKRLDAFVQDITDIVVKPIQREKAPKK